MSGHLYGAKPEPLLDSSQLDHEKYVSMNFYLKIKSFHSRKCIIKRRLENDSHFESFCVSQINCQISAKMTYTC